LDNGKQRKDEKLRIFISKLHVSASSGLKEILELAWQLGE